MSDTLGWAFYPRFCFHLAPTANVWCFLRIWDLFTLQQRDGFEGEGLYFYRNLPIKWVRIVGVVVAIDTFAGLRAFTIDDSSGACIEAIVSSPKPDESSSDKNVASAALAGPLAQSTALFADIDVGSVMDVKGALTTFRDTRQLKVEKMAMVRGTAEELKLWAKRNAFRGDVLDKYWALSDKTVRKCRQDAQRSEAEAERKRQRLEAASVRRNASSLAKGHSLFSRANRPTVTKTVTVVETAASDCPAPKYTFCPDDKLLDLVVSSTSLRTISEAPSTVVYNASHTVTVVTTVTDTATICSLPTLTSVEPQTEGVLNTELGEPGQPTQNPLLTEVIPTLSSLRSLTSVVSATTSETTATTESASSALKKVGPISETASAPFPASNSTFAAATGSATGASGNSLQPTGSGRSTSLGSISISLNATSLTTASASSTSSSLAISSNATESVTSTKLTQEDLPSTDMVLDNIFAAPIDIKPLPRQFSSRPDHPVPRTGIQTKGPLQTNKFYSNLFLGNQRDPVFTYPYSVSWVDGTGVSGSYGIACSHVDAKQRVFGPPQFDVPASYFINPIGIHSMIISAKELGKGTKLTVDSMTASSIRAHLSSSDSSEPIISFPLVQGMAYITAEYNGATPLLQTGVFFRNMTRSTQKPKKDVTRYTFVLEDGTTWRVYGHKTKGDDLDLQVVNNGVAMSAKPFYGTIHVAKEATTSDSDAESKLLDQGAGVYPTTMKLSGNVNGAAGSYAFNFEKAGHQEGELLMFALPHHVQSFDKTTQDQQAKGVSLMTPTKGRAALVQGTKWNMVEPSMPVQLGFEPYDAKKGSVSKLSGSAKSTIKAAASKEILQDMIAATDLDSMYFSGKALAKYALMLYVINDMLGETKLAQTGLGQLKVAFARFADNKQKFPLVHETAWGGVVSTGAYKTGQALEDFGNTYYNDHHFHYGYHILTAALIGHLDKTWVGKNKDYVNMLVRDTSNPSGKDALFPEWRSFDWYHGHSWATGLYASLDGKNQESSSEDMMHAYALKMWGKVSRNAPLEARANLQLAITARSVQQYYLYEKDNTIQPGDFIGNKVAGILFENKIHHTTFFGNQIEFIQGIHMLPILPVTTVARTSKFVEEEWEAFFSKGRLESIDSGWKSILLGSYATIAPKEVFEVLSDKKFDSKWLDGGISLTWLLAYSAALGGL
ncbi:endo-1,3-beta-glucanase Engl1 [Cordyceps javanica]|uniref:glucan endo-1,3-beta-D-glucosidase n=1 Tax=Cordyceps javanica TaxID=43265 RepID=A0A545V8X3_9HYPO|nr:endo-1,3-beta-glucanase Engl1 [Cordyceps javanica]TQW08660.1 endo-1,3-beta-glucanase Engl1 [Cordyceps javanica]